MVIVIVVGTAKYGRCGMVTAIDRQCKLFIKDLSNDSLLTGQRYDQVSTTNRACDNDWILKTYYCGSPSLSHLSGSTIAYDLPGQFCHSQIRSGCWTTLLVRYCKLFPPKSDVFYIVVKVHIILIQPV